MKPILSKKTICDELDYLRVNIFGSQDINKKDKLKLLAKVESCQLMANKIEQKLIEKIEILKDEGFIKCEYCKVWGRPQRSIHGKIYSCCGSIVDF